MSGEFSSFIPETTTAGRQNRVLDPSAESGVTTNYAAHNGATVTQDTTYARFGYRCYKIDGSGGTNRGIILTTAALANAIHYVAFYLYGAATPTGPIQVSCDNTNWNTVSTLNGAITTGLRVGVSIPAAQANTSTSLRIRSGAAEIFYLDAVDCKAVNYATIYTDGDQAGCTWDGLAHGSTSTANAQTRSQGREYDWFDIYGISVLANASSGIGVAPLTDIIQEYALQPGGEFQDIKIHPRVLELSCMLGQGSIAQLHSKRKSFWNAIKPDLVAPTQPFILSYKAANSSKAVYLSCYYESGMEITDTNNFIDKFNLRLIAVDPFWYEDAQEQTTLSQQLAPSADYAYGRINGLWQRLGTGFNHDVNTWAIDYAHNRIYVGGLFTTANGVTCNGIAYWDGTTFQPLGAGTKGIGVAGTGQVFAIAIAPNGDIWAAGDFSQAGGSATKKLAMWAYPGTGAPTVFNVATTAVTINSIVIDKNYRVYICGDFTAFASVANASYFIYSNDQGTNWVAPTATVATGGVPVAMALDIDGLGVYLGGTFTGIGGVTNTSKIAKYSGSAFSALSTGRDNNVYGLEVSPNGTLYAGGTFTNEFSKWNGISWTDVSGILGAGAGGLNWDNKNGIVYIQPISLGNSPKYYNGSGIQGISDITGISSPNPNNRSVLIHRLTGDIYYAPSVQAGGTVAVTTAAQTTVTANSTTITYPQIVLTATTTAASTTTLNFIENYSTGQRLYINSLGLQTGETLTIDLRPGKKTLTSNWRGDLTSYVLSNSDLANFRLLPGANTIALYLTGTLAGALAVIQDVPQHISVDGVAA